jgi:hypothetical protein
VNATLGKPRITEAEALLFYRRIGARGKTPVINHDILDEMDSRSIVKGALIGVGITLVAGAALWLTSKAEKTSF